ncbi:MAG TPA: nitroreductase family deazaflavin-dependent oxidoreductase [Pseudonocardiaceae bacterium]|jgi:deazaflavin-dependent oxidoreductase (nitroreductase family)|nr:nitroreductase family deazaflavin-dependent oxidoreductase [Pseudonocardiaceae bacterium]
MSTFDNPVDARADDWVGDHLRRYAETGGVEGYEMQGAPTLLLTTIGRKSGQARRTPLIYGRDGDQVLIVASLGGAPQHPLWYLNLQANPAARIQIKDEILDVTARTATEEEKPRLWKIMADIWPAYDDYQTKTDRAIPIVILDRVK